MLPIIEYSAQERATGVLENETLMRAAKELRVHGCVMLRDVFSAEFIRTLHDALMTRNEPLLQAQPPANSGEVGPRRFMGALDLSPPFATPQLYANPLVLPILRAVLGKDMVLGICGTVTSLPGAGEQHVHWDGPPLFNKGINRMAPAHAVSFFVPLIEFNDETGTTRLYPDTHLKGEEAPGTSPYVDPVVPVGSCMLTDYRLLHQGRANRSNRVRPLLFSVYHMPWFKDYLNHPKRPFLRLSPEEYAKIPAEHRGLFSWTEHYRDGLY